MTTAMHTSTLQSGSLVTGKDDIACTVECPFSTEEFDQIAEATLNKINISHTERSCLEESTREQSTMASGKENANNRV